MKLSIRPKEIKNLHLKKTKEEEKENKLYPE